MKHLPVVLLGFTVIGLCIVGVLQDQRITVVENLAVQTQTNVHELIGIVDSLEKQTHFDGIEYNEVVWAPWDVNDLVSIEAKID